MTTLKVVKSINPKKDLATDECVVLALEGRTSRLMMGSRSQDLTMIALDKDSIVAIEHVKKGGMRELPRCTVVIEASGDLHGEIAGKVKGVKLSKKTVELQTGDTKKKGKKK